MPLNPDRDDATQQAAIEAAQWLTQESNVWGTKAGHLPASESLLEANELRDSDVWDKTLSTFYEMADNDELAYVPRTETVDAYQEPIYENLSEIYSQNISLEEGIKKAAEVVNRELQ
ncbi:hypothetical protein [Halegenticoccus tardaugens]|uniref:hypothetical protein n=1 Tax=Halegenticoccus tardaugens TaxID=2071624 RepID=UPI00100B67DD|nr:hypothetical protein [Halegenticoccus tardaugens]